MKTRLLLVLLSLSISSCSLIYSYSNNLPNRIDHWIAEKNYKMALNTISHIKPNHKNFKTIQRKKNIVLKKVAKYKKRSIKKATVLANKGNWIKAIELLDETEKNIIDARSVIKHRNSILIKRGKVISAYENDVLNSQAQYIVNKMALYKKINKTVYKDENNELDISRFDKFRQETSLKLIQRCEQQFKKEQYDNALTTINLALKLNPDAESISTLKNIKNRITKITKLKKSYYIKKINNLLGKLSQGYSQVILKETKEMIMWLNTIKGDEKIYLRLIEKLQQHFKAGIKQNFEAARKLYSKGKTQEALIIWNNINKLSPDHPKLQSHIERAEKVIRKLKTLSNKTKKE